MNICFFCASSNALDEKFYKTATDFAKLISDKNWTLVSGGSDVGIMKTLAQNTSSHSIGIIPRMFAERGLVCEANKEIIISDDLQDRKKLLFDKSDAFVILPGGFGTLDEMIEIITLKQLRLQKKPIIIFNQDGFYDNLFKLFDVFFENKFANPNNKKVYYATSEVKDAINYIENYQHEEPEKYIVE